jgi:uncharacterized protein
MAKKIRIKAGGVEAIAELNDTVTASKIWDALPIQEHGSTWGDEIYFGIPVSCEYENPQEVVELGDIAYWPPGSAFCIFFGRTPASRGMEIRPASSVNVFGKLIGDPKVFKRVADGETVVIERVEE